MARKSEFTFGKWELYTVQQVLDLKGYRSLRWYYYNCSMVSFLPDILDELWITEEWRIEKPGTDPEKGNQLEDNIQKLCRIFGKGAPYVAENLRYFEEVLDGQCEIMTAGVYFMRHVDTHVK